MKPASDWSILRRMLSQARRFWPHLGLIFLLSLLSTPLALLTPLPLKLIIDSVIGSSPLPRFLAPLLTQSLQHSAQHILLLAVGVLLVVTLLTYLQSLGSWMLTTYASEGMVLDFRTRLFAHVQRLSLGYHDTKGTADSAFRIQYDAPSVQLLTIFGVIPLVASLTMLAGMLYVTLRLDAQLALIALAICPALFLLSRYFRSRIRGHWTDVKQLESSANAVVQEALSSMRVVKAFGQEGHEQERFLGRATSRLRKMLRLSALQGSFDLAVGMTVAVGSAATLYVGVRHVMSGVLSLGDLTLVIAYVAQLYEPLKAVSRKLTDLQSGMASAERAFALLDELPEVVEHPNARPLLRAHGAVRFEDVTFSYDGEHPVLSGVNLDLPAGARIGMQGRTGAGKSTLVSLLARFYDVTGGRILVDGIDIRDYRLVDLRNQFGIVLQDTVLFSSSISENIAYGRPGASEEAICDAARLANAHDFISQLPDGYETLVGERGMRLSGGERQRIALARAFLKDAPILILDEPTSAVDVGTETAILEALERLMRGRTTFMIAHRLNTLASCDIILQVEDGRITATTAAAGPPREVPA